MSPFEPTAHSPPRACLPFVWPWGAAAQPWSPSGLVSRGLIWLQREKESVLGSSRSSEQEQVLWGNP